MNKAPISPEQVRDHLREDAAKGQFPDVASPNEKRQPLFAVAAMICVFAGVAPESAQAGSLLSDIADVARDARYGVVNYRRASDAIGDISGRNGSVNIISGVERAARAADQFSRHGQRARDRLGERIEDRTGKRSSPYTYEHTTPRVTPIRSTPSKGKTLNFSDLANAVDKDPSGQRPKR